MAVEPAQAAAGARPVRVMALGDSITRGVGTADVSGYRIDLRGRMQAATTRPIDMVGSQRDGRCCDRDHEGHGGWTTAQILAHVDNWVARNPADVVLLMAGTNDMSRRDWSEVGAARRLARIIARIRARLPGAHIFVAKIPLTTIGSINERTARYNRWVGYVEARAGTRVHLVDMSPIRGGYLADSRHPNRAGYAAIAVRWYDAIRHNVAPGWPAT